MPCFDPKIDGFYIVKWSYVSTSNVRHFGTETDMDLRFFALVHKYSLVLDSIRIEKVIFFRFFGGGSPLKQTKQNQKQI